MEPLLTTSAPRISNDFLKAPAEESADQDTITIRNKSNKKKRKNSKSKKKAKANDVPFPDDPFDIAMAQAEREPTVTDEVSSVSKTTKKVGKKKAMPLEESKTPQPLDMAAIIKLQEESKVPINLNI